MHMSGLLFSASWLSYIKQSTSYCRSFFVKKLMYAAWKVACFEEITFSRTYSSVMPINTTSHLCAHSMESLGMFFFLNCAFRGSDPRQYSNYIHFKSELTKTLIHNTLPQYTHTLVFPALSGLPCEYNFLNRPSYTSVTDQTPWHAPPPLVCLNL